MENTVVEGYMNLPFKAVIEMPKEQFDKLEEKDKQELINQARKFKKGTYSHGVRILFSYDEEEYGEF